jgi:hypothetical protein
MMSISRWHRLSHVHLEEPALFACTPVKQVAKEVQAEVPRKLERRQAILPIKHTQTTFSIVQNLAGARMNSSSVASFSSHTTISHSTMDAIQPRQPDMNRLIETILEGLTQMNQQFAHVNQRFDRMEHQFNERLDRMDQRIDHMEYQFNERLDRMDLLDVIQYDSYWRRQLANQLRLDDIIDLSVE